MSNMSAGGARAVAVGTGLGKSRSIEVWENVWERRVVMAM